MRSLVTGGAGFIGSHLCDALLETGHEVVAVDNLITGHRENVAHLGQEPRFRLVEADVIEPLPIEGPFDYVFSLASPASPIGYQAYAIQTTLTNTVGTWRLLEAAERWGSHFLLASTSEIYGEPLEHPQREDYWGNVNPIGPRSCYDESKRLAETLTMDFLRHRGVDVRVVRIFNTYGPRSDPRDGRVVPNFLTQALTGGPLTVYGHGTQTRSFCYVTDLVAGIERAMFSPRTTAEVYNLGNPEEFTIHELAEVVREMVDPSLEIVYEPRPTDDPSRRRPDISKARRKLDWEPRVGLEEGLALTIEWFRVNRHRQRPPADRIG